jgi:hypothetical protein
MGIDMDIAIDMTWMDMDMHTGKDMEMDNEKDMVTGIIYYWTGELSRFHRFLIVSGPNPTPMCQMKLTGMVNVITYACCLAPS